MNQKISSRMKSAMADLAVAFLLLACVKIG